MEPHYESLDDLARNQLHSAKLGESGGVHEVGALKRRSDSSTFGHIGRNTLEKVHPEAKG